MSTVDKAQRMLSPYEYEVLWHLALVHLGEDATAQDVFEQGFKHGKPAYQRWTPLKVSHVMRCLKRAGLIADSKATDDALKTRAPRRYRLTEKGERWLRP